MEKESKIRTKKAKIKEAILTTLMIAVAGVLNPQALVRGVLSELKKPKEKRVLAENAIYNTRKKLLKQGLIKYENGFWSITDKGRCELEYKKAVSQRLPHPKHWDKKWRILIFDIREEKKGLRDKIRRTLITIGFYRLQDSVWIYPYDCEDLITLLKTDFKIGKDLLYIIADNVENDLEIRRNFGIL